MRITCEDHLPGEPVALEKATDKPLPTACVLVTLLAGVLTMVFSSGRAERMGAARGPMDRVNNFDCISLQSDFRASRC